MINILELQSIGYNIAYNKTKYVVHSSQASMINILQLHTRV
jgi:hypothetical protein